MQQHRNQLHDHFIGIIEHLSNALSGFAISTDCHTKQNGKENEMQGIALRHCTNWVGWEHIHNHFTQRRSFRRGKIAGGG